MLIDKEEVPRGGLLLQEKPFVYILGSKFRTERCDLCFQKGDLLKCSACHYVYYCNRICQKEAWSIHKVECKYLKYIAPRILPDSARFLSRLIKILGRGGYLTRSYYTKIKFRMFKDLMSHYPNLKNDTNRMDHLSSLYGVLSDYFRGEPLPNISELMGMYGRMCVNSFSICTQEFQSLGTGMYLAASIVDHSCKPNAVVTFEGTTLVMRALERIPSLDWTKIYISYIDTMAVTKERQDELQAMYYFLCQCPRCITPEPVEMLSACCPNSKCKNSIDVINFHSNNDNNDDSITCVQCGTVISKEFLEEYHTVMELTEMHLGQMKETTYLDVCNICLKKHRGLLHRHNVKHVKIKDLAFDSSIEFGKFEDALEYGLDLVESFYKYYGEVHPMTGVLHLKLGKLLLYFDRIKEAIEHFKLARKILEITHGFGSSIFRQQLIPSYKEAISLCKQQIMMQ